MSQAALKGDLGRFQPAEVLQFLQLAQISGRLELSRPATGPAGAQGADETVDVFFVEGRPVFARTSGQSVRTGEILVHRGHATHDAVIAALEAQLSELHRTMAEPAFYRQDPAEIISTNTRLQSLEKDLAEAYRRWEYLEERKAMVLTAAKKS